ncbi:Ca-activated chloride channel homolog [Gammaproteobacteria bacterium]
MKRETIFQLVAFLMLLFQMNILLGKTEITDDKTLSPYFFVKSNDATVDQLPLKSTDSQVNIAGVIADVKVAQVYKNEGKQAIEAIYIFPASTRAAVYAMKMTIGERAIIARIQEKQKARQEYELAKQQGKSASLLEQQRPNVFQMNVANIMPGDLVRVELSYIELLVPNEGIYEFIYPAVVGPRYSNKTESRAASADKWIKNPYLYENEAPPYEFGVTTRIAASLPIQEIFCSSHKVNIDYENAGLANVQLDPVEKSGGNRDYILKYRLAGGRIESGLLLYQGEQEKFFLLMMQPPNQVTNSLIPAREYIFIVDISGSMHGFPLEISKQLLKDLIGGLKPEDTFNLLLFAGSSSILAKNSLPATSMNINKAIKLIENQDGGGGTELLPALRRALALPGDEKRSRSIVIATDGYVDVEKETFQLIRENLGKANIFSFGIGSSVNRYLMEGIARAGMGEPFIITKPDEASLTAEKFRKYIQSPVLTRIKINFGDFMTHDVEPTSIPDIFAERPVIVFGKWEGEPKGLIKLEGISVNSPYSTTMDVSQVKPSPNNSALRYLWARSRISMLADYNHLSYNDKRIEEITRLGIDYNLLTEFTSFVAIDSLRRNADGKAATVNQPLPLPQGVSDLAVGSGALNYSASPAPVMSRTMTPPSVMNAKSAKFREVREEMGDDVVQTGKINTVPGTSAEVTTAVRGDVIHDNAPHAAATETTFKDEKTKGDKKEMDGIIHKVTLSHLSEQMIISNNLSRDAIEKFILSHLSEIEQCYRVINQPDHKIFSLKINIDGNGQLLKVEVEIENQDLKSCIAKLIQSWVFPATLDGKHASVQFFLKN